jgi:hypothetical protein
MPNEDPKARREYHRRWMSDRRAEWLAANGPCVDCGATEDLQLSSADGTAKPTNAVWSASDERRQELLKGYVVRCFPCFTKKRIAGIRQQFTKPLVHGTLAGYEKKGCRCANCLGAMREARQRQRAKRV